MDASGVTVEDVLTPRVGRPMRNPISPRGIRALITELLSESLNGRTRDTADRIATLRELVEHGAVHSLDKLLPCLLNLDGKPYNLVDYKPFVPLYRAVMPKNTVYMTGRQVAKTLLVSAENCVSLENGQPVPGHTLVVGDRVLSMTSDYRSVSGRVVAKIDSGRKDVLRVETRLGSIVLLATTHPLKTVGGWKTGGDLRVGDRVAAMRRGGRFGRRQVSARVLLTAYMIGDGCCGCSGNWNFTGDPGPAVDEFTALANRYERQGVRVADKAGTTAVSVNLHRDNRLLQWIRQDGLEHVRSPNKFLPAWVFSLSRTATAAFISRLWATDGTISAAMNGTPSITYCTTSPRLAKEVRALLAKFGIPASISQKPATYRDDESGELVECGDVSIVRVETRSGWRAFLTNFAVPGKPSIPIPVTVENNNRDTVPQEVQELIHDLAKTIRWKKSGSLHAAGLRRTLRYPLSTTKARRYLAHFEQHCSDHPRLSELRALLDGDVIWDEVVSIEPVGREPCWDIEVETNHNYILNGLLSHNSTNLAAHDVLLSNAIPNHKTLFVTPLYEQIRRFSNNYVRPFINQSPLRTQWIGMSTENSVLQRSFRNGSRMMFSFALLDSDRIRGVSTHKVAIDEVQDMDPAHLPIIAETQTAAKELKSSQFTGTSKTSEGPLQALWLQSSQAEWFIPCFSCGQWNIPSKEYHLEKMLGPVTPHISERYPGTICHSCSKPVSPRYGRWVHRYPDRRWLFAGYHIPQVILPLHYASLEKWSDLIRKRTGWGNTTESVFWNEVMGEAVDAGQKLITKPELMAAAKLPWKNNTRTPSDQIRARLDSYKHRILAIDWGGGGEEEVSFTTLAVLGFKPNGQIDVLWGKRLLLGCDHLKEALECMEWHRKFNCDFIVHDYTGAGEVRETVLIQAGFNPKKIFGVRLCRAGYQDIMVYHGPTNFNHHAFYTLDKARSLLYTCNAIKLGRINFFQYDYEAKENPGLIEDFLALQENNVETRLAGNIYTIIRNPLLTDDFAQAVNLGVSMLWQINGSWPDFAKLAGAKRVTQRQIETAGNRDYGWEVDPIQDRFFNGY